MILYYLVHPLGNQKPKATPLLSISNHMALKFRDQMGYSTYESKKVHKN